MSSEQSSPGLIYEEESPRNSTSSPHSVGNDEADDQDTPYEERFRVDRRKLEQMLLQVDTTNGTEAEEFFLDVMESTNTNITWPSKLKIGAKSKKDPHIKVMGDVESVKQAKEKILTVLDTKSNRVTLKMDVAHTEHSHVIGKGGNNIRKVMEDTGCHIHFPDSNRSNQTDKSNQVSIAGQPYGVECARMKIRELLPIVFMFELPIPGLVQPDQSSPVITRLQQQYNVTIAFRQQPRTYSTAAIIRGTATNAKVVKEATVLLMEHLTGSIGTMLPVSLQLEVAAQHHLFMIGRGGTNMQQIMAKTGANICFPDPNTVSNQRKGTIYITGSIDSVLAAREQIIGCLPLVLMFDLKEDIACEQSFMNSLMEKLDVFISVKPKPKQPSRSVIVKSIEQNARNMYEARCLLLRLEREEMPVLKLNISSDTILNTVRNHRGQMLNQSALSVNTTKPVQLLMNGQVSPLTSPCHTVPTGQAWTLTTQGALNPIMLLSTASVSGSSIHCSPHPYDIYSAQHSQDLTNAIARDTLSLISGTKCRTTTNTTQQQSTASVLSSSTATVNSAYQSHQYNEARSPSTPGTPPPIILVTQHSSSLQQQSPVSTTSADRTKRAPSPVGCNRKNSQPLPPRDISVLCSTKPRSSSTSSQLGLSSNGGHLADSLSKSLNLQSGSISSSSECGGLRSLNQSGSALSRSFSLRYRNGLGGSQSNGLNGSHQSLSGSQSNLRVSGGSQLDLNSGSQQHLSRSIASIEAELQEKRGLAGDSLVKPPPGITQPPNGAVNPANVGAALADYERKKVMATKAISEEPDGEARNPTDFWSGLGFSRSMPDSVIRDRLRQNGVRYDGSNMATTFEQQESEEDGDPWKDSKIPSTLNPPRKFDQFGLNNSLSSSNPMDNVTSNGTTWVNNNNNTKSTTAAPDKSDMAELFMKLGLDRYIDLFQQQEIDLATFTTLNDQDLKELGISTFGARRKMLLAIADLQKSRQKYFSPIPGSNNPFRQTSASGGPFPLGGSRHSDIISQSGRW